MPRRRHTDPPSKVTISLPSTLLAKISLILFDPVRGKRKHGELSSLITKLLEDWIKEQAKEDEKNE